MNRPLRDIILRSRSSQRLFLPGVAGNYASTAKIIPTGTFRVEWFGAMPDWTPATAGAFAGVYDFSTNNRSWRFELLSTGIIQMRISSDGTAGTVQAMASTVAPSFNDGGEYGVGVTINLTAGTADFSTSLDGVTWTTLGTQVSFTTATLFNANTALEIGTTAGGTDTILPCSVKYCRIYQTGVLTKDFSASRYVSGNSVIGNEGTVWAINTSGSNPARIIKSQPPK